MSQVMAQASVSPWWPVTAAERTRVRDSRALSASTSWPVLTDTPMRLGSLRW